MNYQQLIKFPAKLIMLFLLIFTLLIGSLSPDAFADINPVISVEIDGKLQQYDQPPVIQKGFTLVPLRAIFEALGAEIEWNSTTRTATAMKEDIKIEITIGKDIAYVNGHEQQLDIGAQIINGHTMVPLRFISQAFGASVSWIPTTKTVSITMQAIIEKPQQEEYAALQAPLILPKPTAMLTVPQSQLIRSWKSFDTQYFRIYYYEQEQDIFILSQFFDEIYEDLTKKFGHPLPEQIPVYFLNTADYKLQDIVAWSIAYWSNANKSIIMKMDSQSASEMQLNTFRHELTHAITLSSIDSQLEEPPSLFKEGVATYYEQAKPYYDYAGSTELYKALQDNKIIAFSEIALDSSQWSDEESGLIYAEAQSFYGYLVEQYGETNTNEIFYTSGDFSAVLKKVTSQTISSLEEKWRTYLELSFTNASVVQGRFYYTNGLYEGGIKNGLENGEGKYYKDNKLIYSGEYKNGKMDGKGTYFYSDGSIYAGEFKEDKSNGYGKLNYTNGDRYEGNFVRDDFEGQGTFYWVSGDMYIGEWKAGIQEGQGVLKFKDGSSYSGIFKDGEKVN
jgi:hypothetical protein